MKITYPPRGRGAWSSIGGTLSLDGKKYGMFYRAPASGGVMMLMPGTVGYRANKFNTEISINDFAVYAAVQNIQRLVGATDDGLFGPTTAKLLATWQRNHKLVDDGIFGPVSSKAAFRPLVIAQAKTVHPKDMAHLGPLCCGHIQMESMGWDLGAVGGKTPHDLGLGQINGLQHPDMSEMYRFDPTTAIAFIVVFVAENIKAFPDDEEAQIAAYNLGRAGARAWVQAGKPDVFGESHVRNYIGKVYENII